MDNQNRLYQSNLEDYGSIISYRKELFGEDGNSGLKVKIDNIHSKINAFNEFYDGEDHDEVDDIEAFAVKRDAINKLWNQLDNIQTTIQDIESFAIKIKTT